MDRRRPCACVYLGLDAHIGKIREHNFFAPSNGELGFAGAGNNLVPQPTLESDIFENDISNF